MATLSNLQLFSPPCSLIAIIARVLLLSWLLQGAQEVIVFPPALAKAPHCQRQILGAFQIGALQSGPGSVLRQQPLSQGFQAFISGQLLLVIQARAIQLLHSFPWLRVQASLSGGVL